MIFSALEDHVEDLDLQYRYENFYICILICEKMVSPQILANINWNYYLKDYQMESWIRFENGLHTPVLVVILLYDFHLLL